MGFAQKPKPVYRRFGLNLVQVNHVQTFVGFRLKTRALTEAHRFQVADLNALV